MTNEQWLEVFKEIGSTMHAASLSSFREAAHPARQGAGGTRPFRWQMG